VDALLWLNQLQQTDETQAGLQLVSLHQLFQNGCPVENGFIVPDGCMQTLWRQIDWPREILQDFPELDLNRSRFETA
jgi:phosphoenolpyruvate synthase/pyruvate phosphate dikinase